MNISHVGNILIVLFSAMSSEEAIRKARDTAKAMPDLIRAAENARNMGKKPKKAKKQQQ